MHIRIGNQYIGIPVYLLAAVGSLGLGIYGGTVITGLLGGIGLIIFLIFGFMRGMSG